MHKAAADGLIDMSELSEASRRAQEMGDFSDSNRIETPQEMDVPLERSGPGGNSISMTPGQSHMVNALVEGGMSEQAAVAITSVSQKESGGDHTQTENSYVNTGNIPKRKNQQGEEVHIFSALKSVTEEEDKQRAKGEEEFDNWFWEKVYGKDSRKGKQLGNDEPGDGQKFRGRGMIQLTGKTNYSNASQDIYGDNRLLKNPDLILEDPKVAGQVAAWFISKSNKLKNIEYLSSEEISADQARALADEAYAIVAGGVGVDTLPDRLLYPENIKKQRDWLKL